MKTFIKEQLKKKKRKAYKKRWDEKINKLLKEKKSNFSDAERKKIDEVWNKYEKVNSEWAEYYYCCNGISSSKYIPSDIYFGRICRVLNSKNRFSYPLLQDKNYLDLLFPHLIRPKVYVRCVNGQYLNASYKGITKNEAIELCVNADEEVLIKPSVDTTGARNVEFVKPIKLGGKREEMIESFDSHSTDFIVQSVLKQHSGLDALNSDSINTIRILSLLWNGEVLILGALVRIGVKGVRVDNLVASNGVSCGIDENGFFIENAYDRFGNAVKQLPNGIVFKGYKIPGYKNVVECVKKEHYRLSHFKLIGWDFTVTENEQPVLIETNLDFPEIDFHQLAIGPLFGEGKLFDEVMDYVYKYKGEFIA